MTVEEKARVYAKKLVVLENKDKFSDEANLRAAEYYAYKSHLAGYTEAMRWRDPKEELPKDEQVLVKTDKDKILLVTYWVEKGDFVYWDAPVDNVIGWRPIE